MENKKPSALGLPRMIISPYDAAIRAEIIELLRTAKHFHVTLMDQKGNLHVIASGHGPGEYAMRTAALHRNVVEFEVGKSLIQTIEDFREKPLEVADKIMHQRVEYHYERSKSLYL